MLSRFFDQDYRGAERFADQYAGDTGEAAYVVECFTGAPDGAVGAYDETERGELFVVGAEVLAVLRADDVDFEMQYDATRVTA